MKRFLIGFSFCSILLIGITVLFCVGLYTFDATKVVEDPPEARLDIHSDLRTLINETDSIWDFLFIEENKICVRDLTGEETIIATYPAGMFVTGKHQTYISHNNRYALVYGGHLSDKNTDILLIDLSDGNIEKVTVNYPGFELDCLAKYAPFWLGNETFVVQVHKFTPREEAQGYYREITKFIRYSINDLVNGEVLNLKTVDPIIRPSDDKHSLLVASENQPVYEWPIEIIGNHGVAIGDRDDLAYFNNEYKKGVWEQPPNISITRVVGDNVVEGSGSFYEGNWNKTYIKLNGRIVRCAVNLDSFGVHWDSEIELYFWHEGNGSESGQYYFMDVNGQYLKWCRGQYIGKYEQGVGGNH